MKRILFLTPKPPYPPKDGGALATAHVAEMAVAAGWQVHVLAMSTPKHPVQRTITPPVPFSSVFVDTRPTLKGAFLNLFSGLPYHVVRFQSPTFQKEFDKFLEDFRPQVVQVESPYLTPYVQGLAHVSRVYRLHNIEWQIWERHAQERQAYLRPYFRLQAHRIRKYEERILHVYEGLLPISEKERQWAQAQGYSGQIQLFPFGVEIERYQAPPLCQNPPKIGFIGGLDWLPNQEGLRWFLEKVWYSFRRKHPSAHLFIAGRNTPSFLYRYADAHTHILGEVEDALEFFYNHDILIVPLFSGSGIRIKLIEAFATGRAIVATPIAAESLTYEAGRHLLIAETPRQFEEALSALYTEQSLRERLGQAARRLAEMYYDRKAFLPLLKQFYDSLARE